MKRNISIAIGLLLMQWGLCHADLTGKWTCDDGGTYYIRQIGNSVYWYGEHSAQEPAWSNIFTGQVAGNHVKGNWADVPKGPTMRKGTLSLLIEKSGDRLVATAKTGGFGGAAWNRQKQVASQGCSIEGRITGQKGLVRVIRAYGPDDFKKSQTVQPDANGVYRFIALPPGKYKIVPQSGGKMDLKLAPREHNFECQGSSITGLDFSVSGVGPEG